MANQEVNLQNALAREISSAAGKQALDALIRAGKVTPVAFRQALIDHKVFWATLGVVIANDQDPADDDFLNHIAERFYPAVLKKRLVLGLKEASDAQLLAIIAKNDRVEIVTELAKNDANKNTFGDFTHINDEPQWDVHTQTIINDEMAHYVHRVARRTVLLRKIEAANDINLINNLHNANNTELLHNAAVALGVPAGGAIRDYVGPEAEGFEGHQEILTAAARQGIIIQINRWSNEQVAAAGFAALNDNVNQFKARFEPPARNCPHFTNDDLNKMKGALGVRLINRLFATNPATAPDLMAIASETNAQQLKNRLNKEPYKGGGDGAYLTHAVTNATMPAIRLAAATQLLNQAIKTCNDSSTLNALIEVADAAGLKQVLENYTSLGFKGKTEFQNAFNGATDFVNFIAAAHVQKTLSEVDDPEQLLELILHPDPDDFSDHYKADFAIDATDTVNNALSTYFQVENNRNGLRKIALTRYLKAKLSNTGLVNDVLLEQMVNPGNVATLRAAITGILSSNAADTLITAIDREIGLELRQYAAVEQVVREKKALDLSDEDDHDELISAINSANFELNNPQRDLVNNLPDKEKQALRVRLVEVLITNYQVTADTPLVHLTDLAKAKNTDAFCQALNRIGITELSWRGDEAARTSIQKAALQTAIKEQIALVSPFGLNAHPQLLAFIKTLDLEKQKGLFEKPEVVKALLYAQDEATIKRIIGDDSIDVLALSEENKNLGKIAKIQNAAIAKALARVQPTLDLGEEKITSINAIINAIAVPPNPPINPLDDGNYVATVNRIIDEIGENRLAVARAFGLDEDDDIDVDEVVEGIQAQRDHNASLLTPQYMNARSPVKEIRDLCLRLNKGQPFTAAANPLNLQGDYDFAKFYQDFQSAKTFDEFIQKIERSTYKNKLLSWKLQLTPQVFNEVKQQIRHHAFTDRANVGNKRKFELALDEQKARVESLAKRLHEIETRNQDVAKRLQGFANTPSIELLNPAFQAAARQNAKRMELEFKELDTICDVIITQCQQQLEVLDREIATLPTKEQLNAVDDEIKKAINKRRDELLKHRAKVNEQLQLLLPAQRLLRGNPTIDQRVNPLMHQGILKTLVQVYEGKKDIQFIPFNTQIHDYPRSKIKAHIEAKQGDGAYVSPVVMEGAAGGATYRIVDSVPKDQFREHTLTHLVRPGQANQATFTSKFIEERTADYPVSGNRDSKGNVTFSPNVRLTASHFPKAEAGFSGTDLQQARITYAMAMATQLLAGMGKAPSKENKIRLGGSDPEALRYLWTALVVLGQDANLKFGPEAIEVVSVVFDPAKEMGMIGKFTRGTIGKYSGDSLYKEFEKNPAVDILKRSLKEANKNKVEGSKEMQKNLGAITARYRDELSANMLKELKEQNKLDDTAPRLPGLAN